VNRRLGLRHGLAAVVAAAFVLPLASAGLAGGKLDGLTRVSQDKIVDGMGLHQSEMQPSLTADGTKKTLLGAFEVGRVYNGGSSAIGFATSPDGGKKWDDGLLPLTVAGKQKTTALGTVWRGADPSAAYVDRDKTWLVSSTGLDGTGGRMGLFVNRSKDKDGHKWDAPIVVHAADSGDAPDNGSLACDNSPSSRGYGNCYLAYTNVGSSPANQLQVVTSTDGGLTWSAPVGAADASVGTGAFTLVQPPPPGAAPGAACGRVVVAFVNGTTVNFVASTDCGATFGARSVVTATQAAQHTVAQGLRTSLVVSASSDGAGALYLVWQTRSFRIQQTTLSAASNAGDTNIKVGSTTGMVVGNTLTIDPTGANPETVTITTVGTAGGGGTGVTFTPALAFAHAQGAVATVNGVFSTSTAAPNDIALSVMAAPTDATPEPAFGAPARIPIEEDAGAVTNTVDHFMPAIAADPGSSGASARLALFYYFYPLSSCQYVNTPANQCSPQVGYVSSTDGGASWSASQELSPGPPSLGVLPRTVATGATSGNGNPDLGNVLAAAVLPAGKNAGDAVGLFPVAIPVNGLDISTYTPKKPLEIGGAS
jgi:hypothetical protein